MKKAILLLLFSGLLAAYADVVYRSGTSFLTTADLDGDPSTPMVTQMRQLIGIGGHGGKQHDLIVHFGLGLAVRADRVEISWPGIEVEDTVLEDVPAGTMTVRLGE